MLPYLHRLMEFATQLVQRVNVFYALPMLGFSVSSLLGRYEAGEEAAAAQILHLGAELGKLRALEPDHQRAAAPAATSADAGDRSLDDESEETAQDGSEEEDDGMLESPVAAFPVLPASEVVGELRQVLDITNLREFAAALLARDVEQLFVKLTACSSRCSRLGAQVSALLALCDPHQCYLFNFGDAL